MELQLCLRRVCRAKSCRPGPGAERKCLQGSQHQGRAQTDEPAWHVARTWTGGPWTWWTGWVWTGWVCSSWFLPRRRWLPWAWSGRIQSCLWRPVLSGQLHTLLHFVYEHSRLGLMDSRRRFRAEFVLCFPLYSLRGYLPAFGNDKTD
jgi:hypothetical protein